MIDVNSPFFLEQEYFIRYSEMDYNKQVKPSAFLNFLQDIATVSADKSGFGYADVYPKNLGWFLLKYHIEFLDYPQNEEKIFIRTEARGYNKMFAQRDFEIYDSKNNLRGRVLSYWTLVNLKDKTIVSPCEIFPDKMKKVEKRDDDLSFFKVRPVEKIDFSDEYKVRFDDIDVNMHANNANYIVWAFETLPKEFRFTHKLKTLDMVYKKEIQYGNIVLSEAQLDGNSVTITLKNKITGDELCLIKSEFVEI